MEDILKCIIFLCLVFWHQVFAAPVRVTEQTPAAAEHIVLVDTNHPTPPLLDDLLSRVALHSNHPNVRHVFDNRAFRGFAAHVEPKDADSLAAMSDIMLVEETVNVSHALSHPITTERVTMNYNTRPNAPWGLRRISSTSQVEGNADELDYTYSYANSQLGHGADIYIIDTGIYTENNVFGGRASMLWSYNNNMTDLDGHGTHVSGTAGGDILGVASNANIFGLKALDSEGGGYSSNVIAAIDFAIKHHDARKANGTDFLGSVMSMSLASSSPISAINRAITAAVGAGIHTCVAAGNDNTDACESSPASIGGTQGQAITVGAVDMNAKRASFSNYGKCVDVYAPGVDVVSAWPGQPNMVNMLSGTSMATPHITGIVAYAMANATLANDTALMKEWIRMMALETDGQVLLANNGVQAGDGAGMLGYAKNVVVSHSDFQMSGERNHSVPMRRLKRNVRSSSSSSSSSASAADDDTMMACRHAAQMSGDMSFLTGGKHCNSKRSSPEPPVNVRIHYDVTRVWSRVSGFVTKYLQSHREISGAPARMQIFRQQDWN